MSYRPSYDDIPTSNTENNIRYQPSFEDIPNQSANDKAISGLMHPESILSVAKDVATGMGTGGQNIAGLVTGGYAPKMNLQEYFKARGNPLFTGIGQYALPAIASGGASLPAQVGINAAYGASQGEPGLVNRGISAIEQGALPLVPSMIKAGLIGGKSLINLPGNLGKSIKTLFTDINPKETISSVQSGHDKLLNESSDIYNLIKNEVPSRGIDKIDISKDILDEAESYLPKTRAYSKLINNAKNGNYETLHKLQSDLGKKARDKLSSDFTAEHNEGEEMLDTRDKILESIKDTFSKKGQQDLSYLLDIARNKYAKLKDIYYSHPTIGRMVNPETRKIPSNPIKTFSEESKQMDKLKSEHPEIQKIVDLKKERKKVIGLLKKTGYFSGGFLADELAQHFLRRGQ